MERRPIVIREWLDEEEDKDNPPKVRIEGPFGGGNQDWYKFEVAVMVGGGTKIFKILANFMI